MIPNSRLLAVNCVVEKDRKKSHCRKTEYEIGISQTEFKKNNRGGAYMEYLYPSLLQFLNQILYSTTNLSFFSYNSIANLGEKNKNN